MGATVSVANGYVGINDALMQYVLGIDTAKIYTAAVARPDGSLSVTSGIFGAGFGNVSIGIRCGVTSDLARFLIEGTVFPQIAWAALYEGAYTADTLPPYQPKGYAVELAECQRYYQVLPETSSCIFSISPQSGRYFSNSFALNPMRASPNVTFVTDDNGNIGIVQGVSLVSASEINIVYNDRVKNGILLLSTTNAAYAGLVMSFNGIQFSADL